MTVTLWASVYNGEVLLLQSCVTWLFKGRRHSIPGRRRDCSAPHILVPTGDRDAR